jgi:hypothetical protein
MPVFDELEANRAIKLCAACEHEANDKGVCVFCGALQPDDPSASWEPPVRRPRALTAEPLVPSEHEPIVGDLASNDAANVYVFFMSQCVGMLWQIVGEKQLRGEFEHCLEIARQRFGERP